MGPGERAAVARSVPTDYVAVPPAAARAPARGRPPGDSGTELSDIRRRRDTPRQPAGQPTAPVPPFAPGGPIGGATGGLGAVGSDGLVEGQVRFIADETTNAIIVTNRGTYYVANDYGVVVKEPNSTVWKMSPAGLPNMDVADLVYVPQRDVLYAVTHGQGAWQLKVQ